ncbi:hypothetical protein BJ684DRAFT_17908, partial [Piptocephalis cylindrospora]
MAMDGYCRVWSRANAKPAAYFVSAVLDCAKEIPLGTSPSPILLDYTSFSWAEPDVPNGEEDTAVVREGASMPKFRRGMDAMLTLQSLCGRVLVWRVRHLYTMDELIRFEFVGSSLPILPEDVEASEMDEKDLGEEIKGESGNGVSNGHKEDEETEDEDEDCISRPETPQGHATLTPRRYCALSYMGGDRDDQLRICTAVVPTLGSIHISSPEAGGVETWDLARWDGHYMRIIQLSREPCQGRLFCGIDNKCLWGDLPPGPLMVQRDWMEEGIEGSLWLPIPSDNPSIILVSRPKEEGKGGGGDGSSRRWKLLVHADEGWVVGCDMRISCSGAGERVERLYWMGEEGGMGGDGRIGS